MLHQPDASARASLADASGWCSGFAQLIQGHHVKHSHLRHPMRNTLAICAWTLLAGAAGAQPSAIKVDEHADHIQIDTDALQAKIRKKGYVSGIAAASFVDKKTG